MDISDIKYIEKEIEIIHPATKEPLGIFISLMSPDDDRMLRLKKQIGDKRAQIESKGKYLKTEELIRNRHMVLFTAITGWRWEGDAKFKGEKPELNQKNAFEMFEELPWLVNQIDEQFSELESFFTEVKAS